MLRVKFVCFNYHSLNMATIPSSGTTQRKPRLDFDGFAYITNRVTSEETYWRCTKYSSDCCRSRLHTCKVDGTTLQIRSFNEQIAHRAINTQEIPDIIVTNSYKGIRIGYTTNQFHQHALLLLVLGLADPSIARLPV
jgi:hypothetical protein